MLGCRRHLQRGRHAPPALRSRSVPPLPRALALVAASLLLAGCASAQRAGKVSYAEVAEQAYAQAVAQLDDKNYEQAIAAFEQVRSKFPYSSYAALAELRIADANFGRGRYLEAIDGYQAFVKLHPGHPQIDWAAFRIGESHYKAIPSSFFIFPPPSERDQTEVRAARTTLTDYLARYPDSEYRDQAQKELDEVVGILVQHEFRVADFYATRGHWRGAVGRYEYVLANYGGQGYDAEATFRLVDALRELGEDERAADALDRFLSKHPDDPEAGKARDLRAELPDPKR